MRALLLARVLAGLLLQGAIAQGASGQTACRDWGRQGALLHADDFSGSLKQWQPQIEDKPASTVTAAGGKLRIDVGGGATVWFKPRLEGDVLIAFTRKVLVGDGVNDRLSDLNMFWMAQEPGKPGLPVRAGEFGGYDSLRMYYAGIGGNGNTTSRLRRYGGNGDRVMHADLGDPAFLLEANKDYAVQIAVYRGCTRVLLNGRVYFEYRDPAPLRQGFFGLRTTQSRQDISRFRVWRLH